ncbi:MAG: hypothetical protein OXI86_01940 [Candidatus Poribacteria bacterium]|nr:hypothetical protein [Candidatus Poribacteria bacterium]
MKNLDIYVRVGNNNWKIANQLKRPVGAGTNIRINMRAEDIRVVQKTAVANRLDFIEDIEVYAQKK